MHNPTFTELLERYLSDSLTAEELKEFIILLQQQENANELEKKIGEAITNKSITGLADKSKADAIFQNIMEAAHNKEQKVDNQPTRKIPSKIFSIRKMAAAAAILILLSVSAYLLFFNKPEVNIVKENIEQRYKNDVSPGTTGAVLTLADGSQIVLDTAVNGKLVAQGNVSIVKEDNKIVYSSSNSNTAVVYNTISTTNGKTFMLVLADGSKIWLNAASSVRFPNSFPGNHRRIEITGEAYLEVAPDVSKPFVVRVSSPTGGGKEGTAMDVEVLGTHFNINAYNDEAVVKTTLIEGKVRIRNAQNTAMLQPGMQAQVNISTQSNIQLLNNIDIEKELAWKNSKFIFSGDDIKSVMRQLARWYDVQISYEGLLSKEEFVGVISRNVKISEILKMLEKTRAVSFTIEGRKITVMPYEKTLNN